MKDLMRLCTMTQIKWKAAATTIAEEYYSSTDGSWQSAEKRTDINFDNLVLFIQSIHGIF